jgi:signal transduction protein with GAF and PtsI domain
MSDYKQTRDAAGIITSRFSNMLKNLQEDYEEEIVVVSLMRYYELCAKPDKIDNTVNEYIDPDEDLLWAIERVLEDYMTKVDFNDWLMTRYGGKRDGK